MLLVETAPDLRREEMLLAIGEARSNRLLAREIERIEAEKAQLVRVPDVVQDWEL